MTVHLDLSAYPEEVTNYAFDQLHDRLLEEYTQAEAIRVVLESVQLDYESQQIDVGRTVVEKVLEQAIVEKITDIAYETEHGFRDDYTTAEIDELWAIARGDRGCEPTGADPDGTTDVATPDQEWTAPDGDTPEGEK